MIEIAFWIAFTGATATLRPRSRLLDAFAMGGCCSTLLAIAGLSFGGQFVAMVAVAGLGLALVWRRATAVTQARRSSGTKRRVVHQAIDSLDIIGWQAVVTEVAPPGLKRRCRIAWNGAIHEGVAACFEPLTAGDRVRVIGSTREGVIVQRLNEKSLIDERLAS